MKHTFGILLALLGLCLAAAAATVTATIEFTNTTWGPSNFITIKGVTRRFTNDVSGSPSTLIATNATGNGSATNYYLHTGLSPYGGGLIARFASSNKVQVIGDETLTASIGAGFATLTLDTNGSGAKYNFQGPFSAMAGTNATNQASETVRGFQFATNSIPPTSPPMVAFTKATNGALQKPTITGGTNVGGYSTNIIFVYVFVTNGALEGIFETAGMTITNRAGIAFGFGSALTANRVIRYSEFTGLTPILDTNAFIRNTDFDPNVWSLRTNAPIWSPELHDPYLGGDISLDGSLLVIDGTVPVIFSENGDHWAYFNGPSDEWNAYSLIQYGAFNTRQFSFNSGFFASSMAIAAGAPLTNITVSGITNRGIVVLQPGTVSSLVDGVNMAIALPAPYRVEMSGGSGIVQLNGFKGAGVDGETHELRLSGGKTNIVVNSASSTYSADSAATNRIAINAAGDYLTLTNNGWANYLKILWRSASGLWEVIDAR